MRASSDDDTQHADDADATKHADEGERLALTPPRIELGTARPASPGETPDALLQAIAAARGAIDDIGRLGPQRDQFW